MKIVFFILTLLLWINGFCQTGAISGRVTSRIYGIYKDVMFAQVQLVNTKFHATTDYLGYYKIDSIPAGIYEISASHVEHVHITKKIEIVKDSVLEINFEFTCQYEKHEKDKTCPICHKSESVIPVNYGSYVVPMGNNVDTSYFHSGDQIPLCRPHWYCKRDKFQF